LADKFPDSVRPVHRAGGAPRTAWSAGVPRHRRGWITGCRRFAGHYRWSWLR